MKMVAGIGVNRSANKINDQTAAWRREGGIEQQHRRNQSNNISIII